MFAKKLILREAWPWVWLVKESLVYITKFLTTIDPDMPCLWSQEEDERVTGIVPQGQGVERTMDQSLRQKINKFCIINFGAMEKWIELYALAKEERTQARQAFQRSQTTQRQPYPLELGLLPDFPTNQWLQKTIQTAKANGEVITEEEVELSFGCDFHVSMNVYCNSYIYINFHMGYQSCVLSL